VVFISSAFADTNLFWNYMLCAVFSLVLMNGGLYLNCSEVYFYHKKGMITEKLKHMHYMIWNKNIIFPLQIIMFLFQVSLHSFSYLCKQHSKALLCFSVISNESGGQVMCGFLLLPWLVWHQHPQRHISLALVMWSSCLAHFDWI
jgi:hypothetical protein